MADSFAFIRAILRARGASAEAAASFYGLLAVGPRTRPRWPPAAERRRMAAEGLAEVALLAVHLSVGEPGKPLPPYNDATAAFRRAGRWLRARPPRAFGTCRRRGGRADVLVEVSILSETYGPIDWLPKAVEVPVEFLAACAGAGLPVVLGAFACR